MFDGGAEAERQRLAAERERRRKEEQEAGLLGKVTGLISPHQQQEQQEQSFFDKVTGRKQQKPDLVDHGVDLVQEHVLGEGSQKNEGFVERMKDEHIGNMVRGALGIQKK